MDESRSFDLAVALEYGAKLEGDGNHVTPGQATSTGAPRIVIKGGCEEADWLVRTARRFGVPVVIDESAATALAELPLDDEIPEDMYRAVAVIINQIGALNNKPRLKA